MYRGEKKERRDRCYCITPGDPPRTCTERGCGLRNARVLVVSTRSVCAGHFCPGMFRILIERGMFEVARIVCVKVCVSDVFD